MFQGANVLWMLAFKASKSNHSGGGAILLRVRVVGGDGQPLHWVGH